MCSPYRLIVNVNCTMYILMFCKRRIRRARCHSFKFMFIFGNATVCYCVDSVLSQIIFRTWDKSASSFVCEQQNRRDFFCEHVHQVYVSYNRFSSVARRMIRKLFGKHYWTCWDNDLMILCDTVNVRLFPCYGIDCNIWLFIRSIRYVWIFN